MTVFSGETPQLLGYAPYGAPMMSRTPVNQGTAEPTTEAMRQQAAAVIQRCYRWTEASVPVLPQVAALVPALVATIQQYEAQQYAACLQQALAVVAVIAELRATVPALPAL
ncbi:hypothetical protein Val02_10160 [Virgisporangium aliadipatigenens]|uniref:Uncharacterized protein n=2 Tax=Virgisporangium aliadipatigenens TaxID=741659 RepID=A0A8J3YHL3_9ACTN|nr:hypothetical protein Val02_10160 [Virgisporangium aliadipatigenens]